MFSDCFIVFRQVPVKHRTDGGAVALRIELSPVFVCEDEGDARTFRDSVAESTGRPACIGRAKLWRGSGHGQG